MSELTNFFWLSINASDFWELPPFSLSGRNTSLKGIQEGSDLSDDPSSSQ